MASDATMFGLAHGPVLLAPTEDALDRLRHAVPRMPRRSFVDGAVAVLAGFGDGLVLCHMRRHVDGAKIGHMIGGIVRLVLTGRDAVAGSFAFDLSMISDARRSAVPLACVTMPATASPCRFSMVAWPI